MIEKAYCIAFDCDGWSCRSRGVRLGSVPSWLFAIGAARAAVQKDKLNGLRPIIRDRDLEDAVHTLDLDAEGDDRPSGRHAHDVRKGNQHLASRQKPH